MCHMRRRWAAVVMRLLFFDRRRRRLLFRHKLQALPLKKVHGEGDESHLLERHNYAGASTRRDS